MCWIFFSPNIRDIFRGASVFVTLKKKIKRKDLRALIRVVSNFNGCCITSFVECENWWCRRSVTGFLAKMSLSLSLFFILSHLLNLSIHTSIDFKFKLNKNFNAHVRWIILQSFFSSAMIYSHHFLVLIADIHSEFTWCVEVVDGWFWEYKFEWRNWWKGWKESRSWTC